MAPKNDRIAAVVVAACVVALLAFAVGHFGTHLPGPKAFAQEAVKETGQQAPQEAVKQPAQGAAKEAAQEAAKQAGQQAAKEAAPGESQQMNLTSPSSGP